MQSILSQIYIELRIMKNITHIYIEKYVLVNFGKFNFYKETKHKLFINSIEIYFNILLGRIAMKVGKVYLSRDISTLNHRP